MTIEKWKAEQQLFGVGRTKQPSAAVSVNSAPLYKRTGGAICEQPSATTLVQQLGLDRNLALVHVLSPAWEGVTIEYWMAS
ncbi:MAG TPA: hypothetical protein VFA09_24640, partial [Ktedonobacteraceae bacterium]|nr:hypothetical protein [Ktedonobacteraceae bacterium]